jgi:uncharacterized protein (TIGR00255 family)
MIVSSMTGFARADGATGPYLWAWEIKSVNAKGLEPRFRYPPGFDALDQPVRAKLAGALSRGALQINLSVEKSGAAPTVRINEPVLDAVLAAMRALDGRFALTAPSLDGLLSIRGVMEVIEEPDDPELRKAAEVAILEGFHKAADALVAMRRREGEALRAILSTRLDEIAALAARAEAAPGRKPEAIRARLKELVATLLDASDRFDPDRLHQEAVLMAAKADVREELDRLVTHIAQARKLIAEGGPIGRKLDFLAQELHRETNTLCAKSNDKELSAIGLDLKALVEQFREQVQNVE